MSFDGQNIIQKNLYSILQCEDALEKVELFDRAGYRDIGTAKDRNNQIGGHKA